MSRRAQRSCCIHDVRLAPKHPQMLTDRALQDDLGCLVQKTMMVRDGVFGAKACASGSSREAVREHHLCSF